MHIFKEYHVSNRLLLKQIATNFLQFQKAYNYNRQSGPVQFLVFFSYIEQTLKHYIYSLKKTLNDFWENWDHVFNKMTTSDII